MSVMFISVCFQRHQITTKHLILRTNCGTILSFSTVNFLFLRNDIEVFFCWDLQNFSKNDVQISIKTTFLLINYVFHQSILK